MMETMKPQKVKICDTTLRDGHQSLLATRLTTNPSKNGLKCPMKKFKTVSNCYVAELLQQRYKQ